MRLFQSFMLFLAVSTVVAVPAFSNDCTLGEIRLFAGNFAPKNWAFCDGTELSIAYNSSLFSLIGSQFGGDGYSRFKLPDLRGRAPVAPKKRGAYDTRFSKVGEFLGKAEITQNELGLQTGLACSSNDQNAYEVLAPKKGTAKPITNYQPYVALHYIICVDGEFPYLHQ